mmetsp:Transcript_18359/g.25530  ORF Transcript_18359/g.25530 Transcript_18359/m.25530 type:complete len:1082 (+) Transcript_18359:185-3430(+)
MSADKSQSQANPAGRFLQCSHFLLHSLRRIQALDTISPGKRRQRWNPDKAFEIQQASWCNAVCLRRASELLSFQQQHHEQQQRQRHHQQHQQHNRHQLSSSLWATTATGTSNNSSRSGSSSIIIATTRMAGPTNSTCSSSSNSKIGTSTSGSSGSVIGNKSDRIETFAHTANLLIRTGTLCEETGAIREQCSNLMTRHLKWLVRSHEYPPRYLLEHFARGIRQPRTEIKTRVVGVERDLTSKVGFRVDKATLLIVSAERTSPVRPGMRITHVDGVRVGSWAEYERRAKPKSSFDLTVQVHVRSQFDTKSASVAARQTQALILLIQDVIFDWHAALCGELKPDFHKATYKYLLREADRRLTPSLSHLHRNVYKRFDRAVYNRISRILSIISNHSTTQHRFPEHSSVSKVPHDNSNSNSTNNNDDSTNNTNTKDGKGHSITTTISRATTTSSTTPPPTISASVDDLLATSPPLVMNPPPPDVAVSATLTSSLPQGNQPTFRDRSPTSGSAPVSTTLAKGFESPSQTADYKGASNNSTSSNSKTFPNNNSSSNSSSSSSVSYVSQSRGPLPSSKTDSLPALRNPQRTAEKSGTEREARDGASRSAVDTNSTSGTDTNAFVQRENSSTQSHLFDLTGDANGELEKAAHDLDRTLSQDRWFHFRKRSRCIIASDAVELLIRRGYVKTPEDAVFFGEKMRRTGLLTHVTDSEKRFSNRYLHFRVILPSKGLAPQSTPPPVPPPPPSSLSKQAVLTGKTDKSANTKKMMARRMTAQHQLSYGSIEEKNKGSIAMLTTAAISEPEAIHHLGEYGWQRLRDVHALNSYLPPPSPPPTPIPPLTETSVPPSRSHPEISSISNSLEDQSAENLLVASLENPAPFLQSTEAFVNENPGADQDAKALNVSSDGMMATSERVGLLDNLYDDLNQIFDEMVHKGVMKGVARIGSESTIEGKIHAIEVTCSSLPKALGDPQMSAEDLVCGMSVALALSRGNTLSSDSQLMRRMQNIFVPKSDHDHRGFSVTTYLCAVSFLESATLSSFADVVGTVSQKVKLAATLKTKENAPTVNISRPEVTEFPFSNATLLSRPQS